VGKNDTTDRNGTPDREEKDDLGGWKVMKAGGSLWGGITMN